MPLDKGSEPSDPISTGDMPTFSGLTDDELAVALEMAAMQMLAWGGWLDEDDTRCSPGEVARWRQAIDELYTQVAQRGLV